MYKNAYAAYGAVQKNTETGSTADAAVLEKSALQMQLAIRGEFDWAEAIRFNQKIWTVIQSAMLEDNCPMPSDVRSNIINLSNYIDKRTFEILADGGSSPSKMDILISINKNIALGLRGDPG
jgi:flagellar protein FlaF